MFQFFSLKHMLLRRTSIFCSNCSNCLPSKGKQISMLSYTIIIITRATCPIVAMPFLFASVKYFRHFSNCKPVLNTNYDNLKSKLLMKVTKIFLQRNYGQETAHITQYRRYQIPNKNIKIKILTAVGFEPTPPKRPGP